MHLSRIYRDQLVPLFEKMSLSRGNLVVTRQTLEAERKHQLFLKQRYEHSALHYARACEEDALRPRSLATAYALKRLQIQSRKDLEDLQLVEAYATVLEGRLCEFETSVEHYAADFMEAARTMCAAMQKDATEATLLAIPASEPKLDPLLEAYYDSAGDVKILGERLVMLDDGYSEDLALRELLREHDEEPSVADSAFEQDYLAERLKLGRDLDLAIEQADKLRAECLLAGLDIEQAFASSRSCISVREDDGHSGVFMINSNRRCTDNGLSEPIPRLEASVSASRSFAFDLHEPLSKEARDDRVSQWLAQLGANMMIEDNPDVSGTAYAKDVVLDDLSVDLRDWYKAEDTKTEVLPPQRLWITQTTCRRRRRSDTALPYMKPDKSFAASLLMPLASTTPYGSISVL